MSGNSTLVPSKVICTLPATTSLIDGPPHALTRSSTAGVTIAKRRKPAMTFPPDEVGYPWASIGLPIHCHAWVKGVLPAIGSAEMAVPLAA